MKIQNIAIQNFLGLYDLRRKLVAPVLLIAGPNGAGKSSLLDGIRFAITGAPPRGLSARGEDRKAVVTEGASSGYAEVTADGYTVRRAIVSGDMTGDGLPAYVGLNVALDPARFASMPDDARRRLLFEVMDVHADRETVVQVMRDNQVPDGIIEKVLPLLRGGFDAAVTDARAQASEARGAWKAITGEAYGTSKGATWRPAVEGERPTDEALEKAKSLVHKAQLRVVELVELAGMVRAALPAARLAELEEQANDYEAAIQDEAAASAAADATAAELADLVRLARMPDALTCPCCSASLAFENRQLVQAGEAQDKPSEEALQAAKTRDMDARQKLAEARGRVTAAAGAARSLETATTVTEEQRNEAAGLEEARHILSLHQHAHAALIQGQAIHDQADALEEKARNAHAHVIGWLKVQELCSPDGIPAILIARALDPFNNMLAAYAVEAGFGQAKVERDLSITYAGRPYALCSESEQWRADALFGAVIARMSGAKLLLLDRFDVLQPGDRGDVLDWVIDGLIASGSFDTVIVAGTLAKKPEADDMMEVLWLGEEAKLTQQVAA